MPGTRPDSRFLLLKWSTEFSAASLSRTCLMLGAIWRRHDGSPTAEARTIGSAARRAVSSLLDLDLFALAPLESTPVVKTFWRRRARTPILVR